MMRRRSLLWTALAVCLLCADPAQGGLYIEARASTFDFTDYTDDTWSSRRFAYISRSGIEGHLFLPTPVNACSYIEPPPGGFPTDSTWIALVYDYPSCPSDMVMNVRNAGYRLIIASSGNDSHRTVSKEVSNRQFPIAIVKEEYADYLKEHVICNSTENLNRIFVYRTASTFEIVIVFSCSVLTGLICSISCILISCQRCCEKHCVDKCGIKKHMCEFKKWRRNFMKRADTYVIGMDDFSYSQGDREDQGVSDAVAALNMPTSVPISEQSNFKEAAVEIFAYPNSRSTSDGQDSALQLLSQSPDGVVTCNRHYQYFGIFLLHNACLNGWFDVVKVLVEKKCCDSTTNVYPPSIFSTIFTILLKLLSSVQLQVCSCYKSYERFQVRCNEEYLKESLGISDGTALHCACKAGHLDIVKFLIEQGCDPACRNAIGATPLHFACWEGHLDIVRFLVDEKGCSPACTAAGLTPLHLACWKGHLDTVKFLVEKGFYSACRKKAARKLPPLHFACQKGKLDIVKPLTVELGIDPASRDCKGYTPLHIACQYGHLDIVKFLVEEKHCNHLQPAAKKSVTPLDLANSHYHFRISSFLTSPGVSRQARYEYLSRLFFPPAFKVFVMGNHSVGKSTLVKAIENRLTNTNWFSSFTDRFRSVSGVEPNTAGIIPICIDSKRLGSIIMYDLAGQHEYYSSHAAVLEEVVAYPGSLLMIVVDLSKDKNEIIQQLQYWNSFIESHCSQSGSKPDVVIVGSHADVVKSQLGKPKEKSIDILKTVAVSSSLQLPQEIIPLNCTQLASGGLNEVCDVIGNYCGQFRQEVSTDIRLNFLHAFLCQEFNGVTACRVSEIVLQISMEDEWDAETVSHYLTTISDKSLFLYLRSNQDVNKSWVILDQGVLLSEVNGSVFAPQNFKEHHDISSSTGVVPLSRIKENFPKHDPEMIVSFMSHLEFCHQIAEPEAPLIHKGQLRDNQQQFEKLYFFPALVSIDRPDESRISIQQTHYKCGWSLQCSSPDQFLSRFLHVLLLRLAFSFALAPEPTQRGKVCPVFQRCCNVWKNGIHWQNRDGVEAIVEVVEQNTAMTVMMGCLRSTASEMACVRLRSELIRTILEVKERFCRAVEVKESLIHPAELSSCPLRNSNLLSSFTITELATAIADNKQVVVSKQGHLLTNCDISELLYFEPYACFNSKLLSQLFKDENSNEEVPNVFYNDVGKVAHTKIELLEQALEVNKSEYEAAIRSAPETYRDSKMHHCYLLFRTWALCSPNPTYQALRSALDKFSVLCGRNPLLVLETGLIQSSVGTASLFNKEEPLPARSYDREDDVSTIPHPTNRTATRRSHDQEEDFSAIPHRTNKPRLGELRDLQGRRGKSVKVIEGVATKWEELAKALHFDSSVIEHMRDTEDPCRDILQMWLEGQEGTRGPVTWATLIDSLIEAGFVDIATDVQEAVDYPIDAVCTLFV